MWLRLSITRKFILILDKPSRTINRSNLSSIRRSLTHLRGMKKKSDIFEDKSNLYKSINKNKISLEVLKNSSDTQKPYNYLQSHWLKKKTFTQRLLTLIKVIINNWLSWLKKKCKTKEDNKKSFLKQLRPKLMRITSVLSKVQQNLHEFYKEN